MTQNSVSTTTNHWVISGSILGGVILIIVALVFRALMKSNNTLELAMVSYLIFKHAMYFKDKGRDEYITEQCTEQESLIAFAP